MQRSSISESSDQEMVFEAVVAAMSDPGFYEPRPQIVEVRETHGSYVFLAADRAYKIKKPVVFTFLDYGTLPRRKLMCEEEIALNRRLAPAVYLGVCAVIDRDGRLMLGEINDLRAVEYVVEMRRIPEEQTLAARVECGKIGLGEIAATAQRIATFHAEAAPIDLPDGGVAVTMRTAQETFSELLRLGGTAVSSKLSTAEYFTNAFLKRYRGLLRERNRDGLIRDVHGDLRAEHIVVGKQLEVIDCVEFDPQLRQIDVGADLSFLMMDLQRLGYPDLADQLLRHYREAGGNPGPNQLIAFYAAQRAWIRAKVALIKATKPMVPMGHQAVRSENVDSLLALARSLSWTARTPLLLIVCGTAATGKTTLAQAIEAISSFPIIGSDLVRKKLVGLRPTDRGEQALYTEKTNLDTYKELGRLTTEMLKQHGKAIVDATFRRHVDRNTFWQSVGSIEARLLIIECQVPTSIAIKRARQRERDPKRISDATAEIALQQHNQFEPLDAVPLNRRTKVRTDRPTEEIVNELEALLDKDLASGSVSKLP